jgi:hypothetical protein
MYFEPKTNSKSVLDITLSNGFNIKNSEIKITKGMIFVYNYRLWLRKIH